MRRKENDLQQICQICDALENGNLIEKCFDVKLASGKWSVWECFLVIITVSMIWLEIIFVFSKRFTSGDIFFNQIPRSHKHFIESRCEWTKIRNFRMFQNTSDVHEKLFLFVKKSWRKISTCYKSSFIDCHFAYWIFFVWSFNEKWKRLFLFTVTDVNQIGTEISFSFVLKVHHR